MWKENMMEELEAGEVEYETAEEFLTSLKKEFSGGEEESVKAAELRKLEQGGRTMEEFIQEFKRVARGSRYEGRPLVEEFKRGINGGIRRKLMKGVERTNAVVVRGQGQGAGQGVGTPLRRDPFSLEHRISISYQSGAHNFHFLLV